MLVCKNQIELVLKAAFKDKTLRFELKTYILVYSYKPREREAWDSILQ